MDPELQPQESGDGIPEWVVTFGDMMSLLLTFFIMLVSLSEIKQDEQYQAMVDSIARRFGYASASPRAPGPTPPRNAALAKLASAGRARRLNLVNGGAPVAAPDGDDPRVLVIRMGETTSVGTVVEFDLGATELADSEKNALEKIARRMRGKPQKIEIRGHASKTEAAQIASTPLELAFARSQVVRDYLVEQLDLHASRLRLSSAGEYEPVQILSVDGSPLTARNARVEVFMLTEISEEFAGSPDERQQLVIEDAPEVNRHERQQQRQEQP